MRRWHVRSLLIVVTATVSTAMYASGFRFDAALSGAQEVPAVSTSTKGRLALGFDPALARGDFLLKVFDGEDVTAAHLHCGRAGQNGPVAFFLYGGPTLDVDGTLSRGQLRNSDYTGNDCIPTIGRPVNNIASLALAARDGLIYVNVHTTRHPGGEIRGQLLEQGGHGDDADSEDDDSSDNDHHGDAGLEEESPDEADDPPTQSRRLER